MSTKDLKKQLNESLERERLSVLEMQEIEQEADAERVRLQLELDKIKERLASWETSEVAQEPTEAEVNDQLTKITPARHKEIRELLSEIREFDGTTDVGAFLDQCKRILKQLSLDSEKIAFVYKSDVEAEHGSEDLSSNAEEHPGIDVQKITRLPNNTKLVTGSTSQETIKEFTRGQNPIVYDDKETLGKYIKLMKKSRAIKAISIDELSEMR
ncbi:hypothetical protein QAD02_003233 [Eretmocerus hayati]|uniref:Uncharacterized protein n=1 Tax=Eretmocerus hayati TaxID=131215 RepID=A0ACC2NNT6_9HYME|nr:hypothetical protein QAD02_003233 [Eretmocerus hayati]